MLVEFFRHGAGPGEGPVCYITAEVTAALDSHGKKIPGKFIRRIEKPVVLKGDPERTIDLINSIDRKNKYSSFVLSFEASDVPSDLQLFEEIDDFEKNMFPGLDPDQFDVLWVKHVEPGGRIAIHGVTPKMELSTGRAMNIAPPGSRDFLDAWRDSRNFTRGWASPDDPGRARLFQQDDHTLKIERATLSQGLAAAEDPKKTLGEYLFSCVVDGKVKNRADIIGEITTAGLEITREGKNSISVRPWPGAKPIRLKGALYDQNFGITFDRAAVLTTILTEHGWSDRAASQTGAGDSKRDKSRDPERAAAARSTVRRFVAKRTRYNSERFGQPAGGIPKELNTGEQLAAAKRHAVKSEIASDSVGPRREPGADQRPSTDVRQDIGWHEPGSQSCTGKNYQSTDAAAAGIAGRIEEADTTNILADEAAISNVDSSLPTNLLRDLVMGAISVNPSGRSRTDISQNSSEAASNASGIEPDAGVGDRFAKWRARELHYPAIRYESGSSNLGSWTTKCSEAFEKMRGIYDRTGASIIDRIQRSLGAIRAGCETLVQSERQFATTSFQLDLASVGLVSEILQFKQRIREIEHQADGVIGAPKMNRNDEASSFETEVALVVCAKSRGHLNESEEKDWNALLSALNFHLAKKRAAQVVSASDVSVPRM